MPVERAANNLKLTKYLVVALVGCACFLTLLAAICALGGYLIVAKINEPMNVAFDYLESEPSVLEALGSPVRKTWADSPRSFRSGSATFEFQIAGPKGTADVKAMLYKRDSEWHITQIDLSLDDGSTLTLTPSSSPRVKTQQ